MMLEKLTMQIFSEQLNTSFRFRLGESDVMEAQLVEVKDTGTTPVQEQFSLFFSTPRDRPPLQSLYRVEHEKLGEFDLLLVPVRADAQAMYYEAIFNRLREVE
jgi:hypothetical protein